MTIDVNRENVRPLFNVVSRQILASTLHIPSYTEISSLRTRVSRLKNDLMILRQLYPIHYRPKTTDTHTGDIYEYYMYKVIQHIDGIGNAKSWAIPNHITSIKESLTYCMAQTSMSISFKDVLELVKNQYPGVYTNFVNAYTFRATDICMTNYIHGNTYSTDVVYPEAGDNVSYSIDDLLYAPATTNVGCTTSTLKYIKEHISNKATITLSHDESGFKYNIEVLDLPKDFISFKSTRVNRVNEYISNLKPLTTDEIDNVSDSEISEFLTTFYTGVRNIYKPTTYNKNMKLRVLDDHYNLEYTDKPYPLTEGVSESIITHMFNKRNVVTEYMVSDCGKGSVSMWGVNDSDILLYPRIDTFPFFIDTDEGNVYINNLYLLKQVVAIDRQVKHAEAELRTFRLTPYGKKLIRLALLGK